MTIQEAMQKAVMIQDACNPQAVLRVWSEAQPAVRADTRYSYMRHPVNVLFMSKLASLMEVNVTCIGSISGIDDTDLFTQAYNACEEGSKIPAGWESAGG